MIDLKGGALKALRDKQLQLNLRSTLSHTQDARDRAVSEVENWPELREHARRVKEHALSKIDEYLLQLEDRIISRGGTVVWAEDAAEANRFLCRLAAEKHVRTVIKSKSMTGEEIQLNQALENAGLEALETDLGEYIVQLSGEAPSHIIAPALHMSRQQVADLFSRKLGRRFDGDIPNLTAAARRELRGGFLKADMGISGANFAVAETGTIVVVENEGNAWLSTAAPRIHVALMGIEKVIPRARDLSVFLKILTRSATGQRISSYVHFLNGRKRRGEMDGPEEFYLVLLDNGRSRILQDDRLRQTLHCIRCGACQNACPVFQRIGGHAYGTTYQGPIGSILSPQLLSLGEARMHPFASTLCGACAEVCPVKIPIPEILLELRRRVQAEVNPFWERLGFRLWSRANGSPSRFARLGRWLRRAGQLLSVVGGSRLPLPLLSRWTGSKALPDLSAPAFRDQYRSRKPARKGTLHHK